MAIQVCSEIGRLRKVLLHRPGRELENLMPDYLDRMLFDDIPFLSEAQKEHDVFADILKNNDVDVVYLERLAAEALREADLCDHFIRDFINEGGIKESYLVDSLFDYFHTFETPLDMVLKMMEGIRKEDLPHYSYRHLSDYLWDDYPFLLDPMPNLYFPRDPFSTVGNGVSIHHMLTPIRNRETIFGRYIFHHHPDFAHAPHWYENSLPYHIEGGDILVLSPTVLAIGISQRTDPAAIELYAQLILSSDSGFQKVLAIDLPKLRTYMHLDTVFTMVDRDKFLVYPNIQGTLRVFTLSLPEGKRLRIEERRESLDRILADCLGLDQVQLIRCGGKSHIEAAREQWNDGANTLAVAPGEVIVYFRNSITNRILEEKGIQCHSIPSSELSRGRGGPRCMSMPLIRDLL